VSLCLFGSILECVVVLPDKWGTCTKYLTRRLRHLDSLLKEKWKKSLVTRKEGLIISVLQILPLQKKDTVGVKLEDMD